MELERLQTLYTDYRGNKSTPVSFGEWVARCMTAIECECEKTEGTLNQAIGELTEAKQQRDAALSRVAELERREREFVYSAKWLFNTLGKFDHNDRDITQALNILTMALTDQEIMGKLPPDPFGPYTVEPLPVDADTDSDHERGGLDPLSADECDAIETPHPSPYNFEPPK